MNGAMEVRAVAELRAPRAGRLEGYASVWGAVSADLGGFTESVREGAFRRSLQRPSDILALYDHDRSNILGRVGAGTLRLAEDSRGLHFAIDLPDTNIGRDLAVLVGRRDITGASFAFTTPKGGDYWSERGGKPHRELIDVDLFEVTITALPAYADTSVAKRHLIAPLPMRLRHAVRFLESC